MSFGYHMASQSSVELQEHEKAFRNGDFYVGGWRDGVRDAQGALRRHRPLAHHLATVRFPSDLSFTARGRGSVHLGRWIMLRWAVLGA